MQIHVIAVCICTQCLRRSTSLVKVSRFSGSLQTSTLSNKHYEDLLSTSKTRTTSGISSLYPTRALSVKATSAASTDTGLSSTSLRCAGHRMLCYAIMGLKTAAQV